MSDSQNVLELTHATVVCGVREILRAFDWTVREGEAWAVIGPTGSGKTTLAEALLGRHPLNGGDLRWPLFDRLRAEGRKIDYPSQVVAHVTFREDSRLFSYAGRYYQQRFEFSDSETPLSLEQFLRTGTSASGAELAAICQRFGIADLLPQPFMTLSNGQTRRSRLARAMLSKPEVLVLDDPFIGLDAAARADLAALLHELVNDGKRLVLICREDMAPEWTTNVLRLGEKDRPTPPAPIASCEGAPPTVSPCDPLLAGKGEQRQPPPPSPLPEGKGEQAREASEIGTTRHDHSFSPFPSGRGDGGVGSSPPPIIELRNVTVAHAGHTILDRVSWTVRTGERWAVLGPNGSGKTTLLSLLCGDHPQAYSNDIQLFGRRRGTGETIWDVKRNVGLLSPEFHLYFTQPLTADRAAATGFFDAVSDHDTTPEQNARVKDLFAAFGITHLAGRAFKTLSTGEQRLVLLARALVKRPPLVILDEPFQGLDAAATARCRAWLETEIGPDQTLLFVTHELSELPRTVTQTLRLQKGRVV
ncbi:ATP-binding cassette domain-containing protein [Gemmata palustris]|uniref:ATP-binding cassette domain-containing protein n=1 Tax=Gemmata palustris TaxID=2822762 RepID=UPI001FE53B48|nr:ATP-binding cassette domain-containing protein [Gemmata palustris]